MIAEIFQPLFIILFLLLGIVSPKKDNVKERTKKIKISPKELKKARRKRLLEQQSEKIEFKRYKNKRMSPRQWLHLPFRIKQGLIPEKCVPMPLNWRRAIHESMWWLPRAEKDGWWQEALDNQQVARALRTDYTSRFYETVLDFATGGNVGRHEGGNMVLVIEGLQRTGKSDLAKTIAKFWQIIQWDMKGKRMINPKTGKKGVRPRIFTVLDRKELDKALTEMTPMDILIVDELDKWTGLGSSNRAEGYANLVARIAKTGKSFIFVSPEVRIPTIKALAYIVLITFGICYAYEATRFILSKKSRFTQQYKLQGVCAIQRNWRFAEFEDYQSKKDESISVAEKLLGLATGFDIAQVEKHRKMIWQRVYEDIYKSRDELFFAYSIGIADWRDYTSTIKDSDGLPLIDIEGLGDGYAKYVCQGLSARHKRERTEHRLNEKEGKAIGAYTQEISVSALPSSMEDVVVDILDDNDDIPDNIQMDFRQIINNELEEQYVEEMYKNKNKAIQEKWGQDTVFGKKIEGTQMLALKQRTDDALLSWRLMALGISSRPAAASLTSEGYPRSHTTVAKHFKYVQKNIAGIMDELAFDNMYPYFERIGGEAVTGLVDFKCDIDNIEVIIEKKCRYEKYFKPKFEDFSRDEKKAILEGKPVFLVCSELHNQRMQYWIAKMVTTKDHNKIMAEWEKLGKRIFVEMLTEENKDVVTKNDETSEQDK